MAFFILWTFSQSWALKNLPNLYWVNVEVAAKHSVMEVFFVVFHTSPLVLGGGFYDYARTKKHRSTSYQHIEPQKDISTYKIFSQEKKLQN